MRTTILRCVSGVLIAAAMLSPPRVAMGDPAAAAADSGTLSEIVVTAERREETLQKTSLAIQVLSAKEIQDAGVVQMRDLVSLVPGLQIGQGGAATQIYIRGVGDFGSTPITNPAVATNLDGVYVASTQAVEGKFYDIARVEVLKGPQGTLYGRNASGGAINIITNKPVLDSFSGYGALEIGNYHEVLTEGALNLPLSSTVAVRMSAQDVSRDGYLTEGQDDDHHQSGRLQVLWQSDKTSVLLGTDYTHVGGVGAGYAVLPSAAVNASSAWTASSDPRSVAYYYAIAAGQGNCIPGGFFPGYTFRGNCPALAPYPTPPFPPGTLGPYDSLFQAPLGQTATDNTFWSAHSEITVDLGGPTLTILPAYQQANMHYSTYPGGLDFAEQPADSKAESVEVRLGNNTPKIKWVGGLYYFHQNQDSNELISGGLLQNNIALTGQSTRSEAAFGQLTYSLTDTLRAIAGARFTGDRKTIDGTINAQYPSLPFLPNPANPTSLRCFAGIPNPCQLEGYGGAQSWNKVTWKAGLEQDLSPTSMLYATASTGFKAGGFDQSAGLTPGSTQALSFNPETLTAFELGSRNRFLDERLQLNAEAFYWKYKDHQEPRLTQDGQGVLSFDVENAGNAKAYGVDLDLVYKLTSADTVRASVEYLHSEYQTFTYDVPANPLGAPYVKGAGNGFTSFDPYSPLSASTGCAVSTITTGALTGGEHVNCAGFPLTHAPEVSASLGYEHRFAFPGGDSLTATADAQFATNRYVASDFLPVEQVPSYVMENVYLTYGAPHDRWSAQLFVRNLSNAVVYTGGYEGAVAGFVSANIAAPRTYGGRLTVHF